MSWSWPVPAAPHSQPPHFLSQRREQIPAASRAKGKTRCWFPAAGFSTLLSPQLGFTERQIAHLMAAADENEDGAINYGEFERLFNEVILEICINLYCRRYCKFEC